LSIGLFHPVKIDKFCIETRAGFCVRFSWSLFLAFFNFSKISMLKTARYLSTFQKMYKIIPLDQFFGSYLFSNKIWYSHQVADSISRCQVTIKF